MKRILAQAGLLGLLPLAASVGQVNPNWPTANVSGYAYTSSFSGSTGTQNLANCANPIVTTSSGTRAGPVTASGSCSFSGAMASTLSNWDFDQQTSSHVASTLNTGTFTVSGSANASPGVNSWSASTSVSGDVAQGVTAFSSAAASNYEYIRVSDPTSIYKMVLSISNALSASGSEAAASASLQIYAVSTGGALLDYLGSAYNQISNGSSSGFTCSVLGVCVAQPTPGIATIEVGKNVLNSNGVFAAFIGAYTQVQRTGGAVNASAYAEVSNFSVRLYEKDAQGNVFDATSLHTITFDPDVTVTPEPASLVLMGTGVLAVFGIGRRRRQKFTS